MMVVIKSREDFSMNNQEMDTESLENRLTQAGGVEDFWRDNELNLREMTLADFLSKLLAQKGLKKAEVIRRSEMDRCYAYHIFGGQKENPSRDRVLALALAMELSPKETQHFLHYAGAGALYVRDHFDSVIWYALEYKLGVTETNLLLDELGLRALAL
jgi:hypothetical protein